MQRPKERRKVAVRLFKLDRDAFATTMFPNSCTISVNNNIVNVIVTTEFIDWVESKLHPKQ